MMTSMLRTGAGLLLAAVVTVSWVRITAQPAQPALASRAIPIVTVDGARFRDLNRSGGLDRYEDWRLSPKERAADLVGRMTLEERPV